MVKELMEHYIKSTIDIIDQMSQVKLTQEGEIFLEEGDYKSMGVSSVISFAGKAKGRFILDFSPFLAMKIANNIMGELYNTTKNQMLMSVISEINNTIAGDANTVINNKLKLGLRLAPPIACSGKNMVITGSTNKPYTAKFKSILGEVRINLVILEDKNNG